jgi:hypothetical protein
MDYAVVRALSPMPAGRLDGGVKRVLVALMYAGIVLGEGLVKLLMNVYRGWVGEKAVRVLRRAASALADSVPWSNLRNARRGHPPRKAAFVVAARHGERARS